MTDGTKLTEEAEDKGRKDADEKHSDKPRAPAVKPTELEEDLSPLQGRKKVKKDVEESGFEKHADNDGLFHREPLGESDLSRQSEAKRRFPAHQRDELAIEDDAPGIGVSAGLMTPRGNQPRLRGLDPKEHDKVQ